MGQMVKVYDADGKHVDQFNKDCSFKDMKGQEIIWNDRIKLLNASGHYIRGQTTSKGVKIK